ncbi:MULTISPECIES: acyltransferase family protein [Acinetobacter]|uniref:acyltransferase family protein n=1 Tax=Acinetobacter TaxID=469 RepID=UPI000D692118|nr:MULTISPECIES: acyltransferase family protein [Acinetobacter]MBT0886293.1 acyltransferase [Acinetobacter towneri]NWJ91700.1 acyltransferase [Acinetobacter sp. Swhac1]
MNFRYDINGLRAIAVLAVVVFHFNPQWLPGGFAGVDVFFVISGFLMTSIIFSGVEKNTFNLFKFYNARANRIVPVLAAMSAVLLVFGWFYLLPTDYRDLGRQVEKSSLFISNLLFAKGGGYFDTAEHTKWLLHTWSLSVEWQFYIFFPIVIIALKKYLSVSNLKRVVLGLFLASFIYCIYATYKDSKTAYFLLTSRAWEMLLGGLAFLYPWSLKNKLHQIVTQCLGIILIIASYFLISKDTPWPSYMALIPVLGAYLIVVANYQNNFVINNPVSNYIGKWSYSIYVWHWPLVVLGFYFAFENWWMYGIPLSILLGFLSYQFIEKINFPRYASWKDIYKVKPFYVFLVILACGYVVKKTNGLEYHYPQFLLDINNEEKTTNPYNCLPNINSNGYAQCKIGNNQNIRAIVVGDSHADAILTSISSQYNLKNEGILSLTRSGCSFILNAKRTFDVNNVCYYENFDRLKTLQNYNNTPIFIVSRWTANIYGESDPEKIEGNNIPPMFFEKTTETQGKTLLKQFSKNLEETLCALPPSAPVYIVQPIPEMGFNVSKKMSHMILRKEKNIDLSINSATYYNQNQELREIIQKVANKCSAYVLDPAKYLCKTGKCLAQYNGYPIYRDGDHLNEYGNKLLIPMFKQALNP